jgi:hypothetical protein
MNIEIIEAIDSERDYQDSLREGGRFTENILPLPGELSCMKVYLDKAFESYANNPGEAPEETMHIIRKIVAMGVRAMENYGAPKREGF